jgi:iron complex transport system permease protein
LKIKKTGILLPGVLFLLVILLLLVDLGTGTANISFSQSISLLFQKNDQSAAWFAIHSFRLPRVITAIIAGIALSVSGLQMQTVFRNPLAGPYVLGISSGAGLGVALVVMGFAGLFQFSVFSADNNWILVIASWLGSAAVLIFILAVSFRIKDVMTILVLGIMIGSAISAIISILQYFSQESALKAFVIWTMGSLSNVSSNQLPYLFLGFVPGMILAFIIIKPSNAILLGENYARSIGVNITIYRVLIFTSTSFLTGTVTAFCGPIGFIGIAVPHIARMMSSTSRNGVLLIFTILLGCGIMLLSDIASQLPGSDSILPLNAVTSLIGIPIVLWIVFRKKRVSS